jgi:hypothetical protein
MKYILILCLINLSIYGNCQYKDRNILVGLYTSGQIINVSEIAPPYYKKLNYILIGFYPKIGYSIVGKYNFGIVGNYAFANSTLGNAKPLSGGGYYLKYSFMPKMDTALKFKQLIYFVEWSHILTNGYYGYDTKLAPLKIDKMVNFMTFHVGADFRFKKGFSLGLSFGLGSTSRYKDNFKPESGEYNFIEFFGRTAIQYNFKL